MDSQGYFKTLDYVVFISTIVISFSIGVFYAIWDRRRNTPTDYFLAGRKSRVIPVSLSFLVTFQSSLIVLGRPAETYMYGMGAAYTVVGIFAAYILSALVLVPVIHPLKITSVYKYFEMRYQDNTIRYLALAFGTVYTLFYMGTVTYGACVALEVVMGLPFWATIIIYTMVTAIYTSMGGIKAVIWSDVFQLIIMSTGIAAVLAKSILNAGGMAKVWDVASDRINMNDFRFDPTIRYQFWNVTFGSFTQSLFLCVSQSAVQRMNSISSEKSAKRIFIFTSPIYAALIVLTSFQGAAIFALYATTGCDPLASGRVQNVNGLVPLAVMDLFHDLPGLAGLFIAALSSAALSTLSSCLNSLSAISYEDVLKERYPDLKDHKATNISKLFVIFYGIIALVLSIIISQIPGTVTAIFAGFVGCLDGPTCAIFVLSLMFRRATTKGILIGSICGMIVPFWLILGKTFYPIPKYPMLPPGPTDKCVAFESATFNNYTLQDADITNTSLHVGLFPETTPIYHDIPEPHEGSTLERLYSISFVLLSFIGFFTCMVVSVVVSLLTTPPDNVDERCLFSFRRHVYGGGLCKKKNEVDVKQAETDKPSDENRRLMTTDM